ncbi:MAG: ubiquinol-cytochrome c reductase iron-sulfur subunit [Pseudomonadales bacterium]|nr:ubiquinol-cytochrome c reductase iron-sulfur subunit [Pseudomonadales bacterium]MDP6470864.1 ubiquinol-cytochrome c reductase iron-sulfur subunit [Pseudomonadales bacterium]MDP6825951.1 ubiquinol-cytochrome c reductase iron-sulfur subunit [Pseudomonadales bacterium]MDP6972263.1 ubiquinol-cytochrome c reductase iron-sulfur subunit [Pseudomonadales bacterium]
MSDEAVTGGVTSGQSDVEPVVNEKRRYFLIGATSAVGGVGVVGAAVPFVQSWMPSAKARAAGAPIKIDISKLKTGEMLGPIQAWRGKPIFIILRDAGAVARLEQNVGALADPDSANVEMQPEYAVNPWRSQRPEIGVYIGICTHLGCSPKYFGEVKAQPFNENWQGGWFCPCHGSSFDLAGRVVKGVPAPDNLEVPPYRFETDTLIVIGEEGRA